MTRTPPIPAGNSSPYPLHEPPHDHVRLAVRKEVALAGGPARPSATVMLIGIAVAIGAAATLARFWSRRKPATSPPPAGRR